MAGTPTFKTAELQVIISQTESARLDSEGEVII